MMFFIYFTVLPIFTLSHRLTEKENVHLQKICGKLPEYERTRRSMHTPQGARAAAPWVVRLELTKKWHPNITMEERINKTTPYCTGSLISPRHVLTAAHCVVLNMEPTCSFSGDLESFEYDPLNIGKYTVRFTESCGLDSCKWGGSFKDIHVPVKKAFVAKTWTGDRCAGNYLLFRGDVAVLELAEEVPYSKHVYPACLNSRDLNNEETLEQFGYGYGPSVTDDDENMDELRNFKGKVQRAPDVVCFRDTIAFICSGDSGSGLFVYDEDKRVRVVAPLSGMLGHCNEKLQLQAQKPVKPNLYWICAATGICLNDDDLKQFKMYNEQGLAKLWYKTFEPLSGNDIYI